MSSDNQDEAAKTKELSETSRDIDIQDAILRLERSRERNREHARKTRLRKKARLQALQSKLIDLQQEHSVLKQNVEESNIASILLNLSSVSESSNQNFSSDTMPSHLKNPEPSEANDASKILFCNHISKSCNENEEKEVENANSVDINETKENNDSEKNMSSSSSWRKEMKLLSPEELESTRRERNRLHAKMTRERKKMLISRLEQSIMQLEQENQRLRNIMPNKISQEITQVPISSNVSTVNPYSSIVSSSTSIRTQHAASATAINNDNLQPGAKSPKPDDTPNTEEHTSEHGEAKDSGSGMKLVA